jgi:hypothetical protein
MSTDKSLADLQADLDAALLAGRPTDKIVAAIEAAKFRAEEDERTRRAAAYAQQAIAAAKIEDATQVLVAATAARAI